jgi:hypothetical protein
LKNHGLIPVSLIPFPSPLRVEGGLELGSK